MAKDNRYRDLGPPALVVQRMRETEMGDRAIEQRPVSRQESSRSSAVQRLLGRMRRVRLEGAPDLLADRGTRPGSDRIGDAHAVCDCPCTPCSGHMVIPGPEPRAEQVAAPAARVRRMRKRTQQTIELARRPVDRTPKQKHLAEGRMPPRDVGWGDRLDGSFLRSLLRHLREDA